MIGREKEISKISSLLESSALFPAILLVGPPKSGKSLLMKEVVNSLKIVKSAQVSCLGAPIRLADVFEQILDQFGIGDTCTNLSDFVNKLKIYNTHVYHIVCYFNHLSFLIIFALLNSLHSEYPNLQRPRV